MGLTIGTPKNYLNYFSKNTTNNNLLTKQDKVNEEKTVGNENLDKSSDCKNNYDPDFSFKIDKTNLTAYANGIKMDEKYMELLNLKCSGISTSAQILRRIENLYEGTEVEKLKRMFDLV